MLNINEVIEEVETYTKELKQKLGPVKEEEPTQFIEYIKSREDYKAMELYELVHHFLRNAELPHIPGHVRDDEIALLSEKARTKVRDAFHKKIDAVTIDKSYKWSTEFFFEKDLPSEEKVVEENSQSMIPFNTLKEGKEKLLSLLKDVVKTLIDFRFGLIDEAGLINVYDLTVKYCSVKHLSRNVDLLDYYSWEILDPDSLEKLFKEDKELINEAKRKLRKLYQNNRERLEKPIPTNIKLLEKCFFLFDEGDLPAIQQTVADSVHMYFETIKRYQQPNDQSHVKSLEGSLRELRRASSWKEEDIKREVDKILL